MASPFAPAAGTLTAKVPGETKESPMDPSSSTTLITGASRSPGRAGASRGPESGRQLRHRLLAVIAALALALTALISGIGTANADTGEYFTSHVYMNLGIGPGQGQGSQYSSLISSLRNAAGHSWRNNVMMTGWQSHGLIRLDLTYEGITLQLWFTANNLYLRGFTDTQGNTYGFSDFNLAGLMQTTAIYNGGNGLLPAAAYGGAYHTLNFASDYNDLSAAADRNRQEMPISWTDMWNSMFNLAAAAGNLSANDQLYYARSLMFMIQFTSESARFYDVYGVMADIMTNGAVYSGLPPVQQELENSWAQMSQYAENLSNGTNPAPLFVGPHVGTLYNFGDVQARLAEGIGTPSQVSSTGDWWHTEL
jgi:hypothetical protein